MEETVNGVKLTLTGMVAALTALWGWFGWLVVAWVLCMVIDYASGSAAAIRAGAWSSKAARDGLFHKGGMILVVAVAGIADWFIGLLLANFPALDLPITYTVLICPVVLSWYILTELGSIVENAVRMGANVPVWLPKILGAGKDAVDKAGDKLVEDTGEQNTES